MTSPWAEYWQQVRNKGRTQYVLGRGVLLGALMFGLLVAVPRYFNVVEGTGSLILGGLIFFGLGFLLAWGLWIANERSYLRQTAQSNSADPAQD